MIYATLLLFLTLKTLCILVMFQKTEPNDICATTLCGLLWQTTRFLVGFLTADDQLYVRIVVVAGRCWDVADICCMWNIC
jgi:hypothetical protein